MGFSMFLLAGCSTTAVYKDVPKEHQHAIIKGDNVGLKAFSGSKLHVHIIAIDDISTVSFWAQNNNPRVTPGNHTVRFKASSSSVVCEDEIPVFLRAGNTYQIQAHWMEQEEHYQIAVKNTRNNSTEFSKVLDPKNVTHIQYIAVPY